MRTPPLALGLSALAMFVASSASAEIGAIDPVPSATLLFPYFEADTGDAIERETLLIVENTAASGQLAHVIVWTDRGVPVLDFDLYLTAHGQQRIAMSSLLDGNLPPSSGGTGTGCAFPIGDLDQDAVDDVKAALTGEHMPSVSDDDEGCPGYPYRDSVARGYVTIDTVTECSTNEVTAGTYWTSKLDLDNTLLGSFTISEGEGKPAYGEQAIHVEASDSDTRTNGADDSTFYGNLVAWSGADHRERLPGAWYAELLAGRSDVIVWRDTKRTLTDPTTIGCSEEDQSALDLWSGRLAYFDESEAITFHSNGTSPFTKATGRYEASEAGGVTTPYRSGMIAANLNFAADDDPAAADGLSQAVVLSVRRPDAVGAAKHATMSLGSAPVDGYLLDAVSYEIVNSDSGAMSGGANTLPRAMLDPRAAASLVLPYFEVSLDDPNAAQTQLSILNNTASAMLANVTLFTDQGVATLSFNVYLTGYDIAPIDLRMLFMGGLAANTGTAGQDPTDAISPKGNYSQDINFASCNGTLPFAPFNEENLDYLREAHTGKPVDRWSGVCAGRDYDDNVARGYIVIDDMTQCVQSHYEASYENGAMGSRDNMSGTFMVRGRDGDFSYGGALIGVHETSSVLTAGDMTFYGWLNDWGISGQTRREGLPNAYRVPFVNSAAAGSTELVFFRPVHRTPSPYECGELPAAFEGSFASLVAYDDDDNSTTLDAYEPGVVAGRIAIGGDGLDVPYSAGSIELDLNFAEPGGPADVANAHMGFIGAVHSFSNNADSIFVQGFPLHLAGEP